MRRVSVHSIVVVSIAASKTVLGLIIATVKISSVVWLATASLAIPAITKF
jgi:hypothetical protein